MSVLHSGQPVDCDTTPQLVDAAANYYGDSIFIDDEGKSLTFIEFRDYCRIAASALVAKGFKPGQKAAIWAPNMHEWIVAALAIQYAGGVLVTVNTRYKGAEAASILRASDATILFAVGDFLDSYYPDMLPIELTEGLLEVVVFGAHPDKPHTDWNNFLTRGRQYLRDNGESAINSRAAEIHADDPSDIMFTSGTTGAPKGVVTLHGQNLRTFALWTDILGLNENDRYLVINPFFHSFGYKAGILACLLRGTMLLPHKVFETETILKRVQQEKITMLPGPPTLFQSILAYPELKQFDISSLKKATTGAAVIAVELIKAMRDKLDIPTVITAYGLSECCGLATMCRLGDPVETIATTSGRALPDVEVRCVNLEGQTLAAGKAGEIVVRGFNVMAGYLDNQEATNATIDAQGWLHTGDIGTIDDQGNLSITDRLKDMFITGGFNCYPAEIENQLCSHPAINMAAVIGIPDERLGEVAMAWLVLNPNNDQQKNAEPQEKEISNWCKKNMANFKVPREFRFVSSLPMNASGKVLKTKLRELYQSSSIAQEYC